MIIVIIDGVAGINMLINFTYNVKLWEIAITLGDSSNSYRDLDGSIVFATPRPPSGGRLHSSRPQQLSLHPLQHSAKVADSVNPSHL